MAMDAAMVAFLVTGAFISVLYYPHFWILTAFSAAAKQVFDGKLKDVVAVGSGNAQMDLPNEFSFVSKRGMS
jgi:hypothetical protein